MAKVLISLPQPMLKRLDSVVELGNYSSRSEAIRDAIRKTMVKEFIESERGSFKGKYKKEQLTEKDKEMALREFAKERGWTL